MSTPVSINLILALPFVLAIIGVPLWMTWKHTDIGPDVAPPASSPRSTTSGLRLP